MPIEIEWKFVVTRLPGPPASLARSAGTEIVQGYFSTAGGTAVRVRMKRGPKGASASLDVKAEIPGTRAAGAPQSCREFCYEIPVADAEELLALAPWRVAKTRWLVEGGIELDVFEGPLAGLVLAEVEVPALPDPAGAQPASPAGWSWTDVSADPCYANRVLAERGLPPGAPRCALEPRG